MAHTRGGNGTAPPPPTAPADRLPPYNAEAEDGVNGAMLLDNDVIPEVTLLVRPGDFYREAARKLHEAILAVDARGDPADALTVREELVLRGDLESVGGVEYLADVMNSVPTAANAKYYAAIVRQKAVARGVIEACQETLTEAYSYQHTAAALADNLARRAADLNDAGVADSVTGLAGPLALFLDGLDRRRAGPAGLLTGFAELDGMLDGLQGGMLYVVAGRPGMGKSVLALGAAAGAAAAGCPALFFSLEMRSLELSERLMCAVSGVPAHRVRNPLGLDGAEGRALAEAYDRLKATPLYFDDTPTHSPERLAALARKYHRKAGVRLVCIDYLQLLSLDAGDGRSRQEQVAAGSRRLKILARVLDVPVVLVSQLNRQSEVREGRRPVMADLRESGAIEQDADVVILVHRPDRYKPDDKPGVVELIVDKNRNGATGVVDVGNDLARFRLLDDQANTHIPRPAPDTPDVRANAAGPDF